jgi:regulator of replication initiation timing
MDKETLISRITEIGTCEDEAQRRELLTAFQEEACNDYDEHETLRTANAELTQANEDLRSANMKLFLRMGEHKSQEEIAKSKGAEIPPTEEKKDFKDLFDEKGNLK